MNKNQIIIMFLALTILLISIWSIIYSGPSDIVFAEQRLERFRLIEDYCGKGNVREDNRGFTCYNWRKVRYLEDKK